MTRALARTLAPAVRVNAVAPGVILLPDGWDDARRRAARSNDAAEAARASVNDVVSAVIYLVEADYVTGETIVVDGGRHVRR